MIFTKYRASKKTAGPAINGTAVGFGQKTCMVLKAHDTAVVFMYHAPNKKYPRINDTARIYLCCTIVYTIAPVLGIAWLLRACRFIRCV